MHRRDFMRICAASAVLGAQRGHAEQDLRPRLYTRALLVDQSGKPLRAAALVIGKNYIFHYPFEATPCFLLNLGKPTMRQVQLGVERGGNYEWPGGVGPANAIVAYSAICAHRMSYPTPQISFISYRERSTAAQVAHSGTIHCCSEHSEYDPAAGARVMGGPARQPLAAIMLDYQPESDALNAVGTLGGELFNAFFARFEFKLALDYGGNHLKNQVSGKTVVMPLENFCKQQVRC